MPADLALLDERAAEISRSQARKKLFEENPTKTFDEIFRYVSNGGDLISWSEARGINYGDVCNFIRADPKKEADLAKAYQNRNEWGLVMVMREVHRMALVDIRELYDASGALKPVKEWPAEVAAAVQAVDTMEKMNSEGELEGQIRKLKMVDKLKALEMLGREFGLFQQKLQVNATHETYEQFMARTYLDKK